MDASPQRGKLQDNVLSLLDVAITAMDLARDVSSVTPAKAVFGSVSLLLTMIRARFFPTLVIYSRFTCDQDSMANRTNYIELGLACADVCKALERGLNGKELDDLGQSVREAIDQLTR